MEKDFEDYLYQRHYKQRTVELFKLYTKRLNHWLSKEAIELTACSYSDLLSYIKHLKKSNTTDNTIRQLSAVKRFFEFLKYEKIISKNPSQSLFIKGSIQRIPHDILSKETLTEIYNSYQNPSNAGKRDKLMLSFVIYQGLFKNEVLNIEPNDISLLQGTVYVIGNGKTKSRTLQLEAHQIIPLQQYIKEIRPALVKEKGTDSVYLFLSIGKCINAENSIYELLEILKKRHPALKNFQHIRVSLISHWIKEKNIREVQHLAGHKTIVGTEMYKSVDLRDLQESLIKFHPLNKT